MNWYKKSTSDSEFNIWIGKEIARVTDNFRVPLPYFSIIEGIKKRPEDMVSLIKEWYNAVQPNLSNLSLTSAMIAARDYIRTKNELV